MYNGMIFEPTAEWKLVESWSHHKYVNRYLGHDAFPNQHFSQNRCFRVHLHHQKNQGMGVLLG